MIYLLRLVSEGYNFGLIRLYLMWFEICKYMYMYIYIHTVYALYAMGPMWVTMLIFDMIFEWFDLINGFIDVWFLTSIPRTKSYQAPHTQHTHTHDHTCYCICINDITCRHYGINIYIYVKRHINIKIIIYIYAHNDAVYTCSNIYIYMCVYLCAHACGKWSAWGCSFREFTPGCYRPSAEQNDRNCFLLAQIQQSQLEDQSNGALRRPLIGRRTAPKSLWWNSCRNWTALRLCSSLRILTWQLRSEASNPELDQVHVQLLQVDKVLFHSVGWVISGYSSKRNIGWWHIGKPTAP